MHLLRLQDFDQGLGQAIVMSFVQANRHKHLNTLIPAIVMNVVGELGVVMYDSKLDLLLMPPPPHHGVY